MSIEEVENFKREAFIMSRLRHPNIALFMGIVSVSDPTSDAGFESLYILSEFMEKGTMRCAINIFRVTTLSNLALIFLNH